MVILENIDIDIDKAILQNIDIDKISNRFKFGISNRATGSGRFMHILTQHLNFSRANCLQLAITHDCIISPRLADVIFVCVELLYVNE